jgi:hypothetical protein
VVASMLVARLELERVFSVWAPVSVLGLEQVVM